MYGGSQGGPAGATPNTSGGATEGGRDGDDIDKVTTSSDKVQSGNGGPRGMPSVPAASGCMWPSRS